MSAKMVVYVAKDWGFVPLLGGDEPRGEGPRGEGRGPRKARKAEPYPRPLPSGKGGKAGPPPAPSLREGERQAGPTALENARVCPTCAVDLRRLVETADLSDRAHRMKGPDGMLLSGRDAPVAVPRRYPECNMAGPEGRRVEFGTVYEETDARARRLERELGVRSERAERVVVTGGAMLERFERRYGTEAARRVSRWG